MSEALGGKDATGVGLTGILAAQGAFGPKFQIAGYDENGKPYSLQAARSRRGKRRRRGGTSRGRSPGRLRCTLRA